MHLPAAAEDILAQPRRLERAIPGQGVTDGAGVRISRVLTQDLQRRLDPFLMLDAFRSDDPRDYIAGFPDHPHRGFETVTYMIAGRLRHRDNYGHQGLLESGGVQWMCAGRGIVHSEMPEQEDGLMEGFQLWLNLPAKEKMVAPWYRDIPSGELPLLRTTGGVSVRVIAGMSHGCQGAVVRAATEALYLDLDMPAGSCFTQLIPTTHNAMVIAYRGLLEVEGTALALDHLGLLANDAAGDGVALHAIEPTRALLLAGRPLGEPISQYGPFVLNTQFELRQAVADFQAGRFGPA